MQSLRFDDYKIYILQKSVQFCGKIMTRSKKRVKWVIEHNKEKHQIYCAISFGSKKKKIIHNGLVIQDIQDSSSSLNAIVNIGQHKMIIMIDEKEETIRPKMDIKTIADQTFKSFLSFKNQYSQLH